MSWVATNKIDYAAQYYVANNPYTYNYSQSSNKLNGDPLLGGWRGIYNYFYDTTNPAAAPWEMLGFTAQPDWWEDRYGSAPYTSGNLVLWDDLSLGRVADPNGFYILPQYARPQLTEVLPTDSVGNLVSPLDSVVGLYSPTTFQRSWKFGDDGPVENAWRTSSSYPFAIMRLMALTKPAEFFSLFVDRDLYKYDAELDQYLYNGRYRVNASSLQIYGLGTSKASYINWIVDYNTYLGNTTSPTALTSSLKSVGVQLAYRMASFSDKNYIKMYIEKPSPNSVNTSLLLPDDSYDLFLYKNQPFGRIGYSSIIVQRVQNGYSVFGYGVANPYFEILVSLPAGPKETISAGSKTVTIPTTYSNDIVKVPYGYVFANENSVCDFIVSYGELLSRRGMIFDDVESGLILSWRQMAQEFLYWSNQGWGAGSIVNLNPTSRTMMVTRPDAVVDSIIDRGTTTLIQDQNRRRISAQDLVIDRYENTFKITSQNEQTINSIDLEFTAYEHIIVFKNVSVFGDLIYNPITAARQGRMLLVAATSEEWNGQLDAQGFILNQDNIVEWQPNVKYTRGQIVVFKNVYYSAATIVQPKTEFDFNDWIISDYNRIQKGLLPNIPNKANQIRNSYNTISANLERDQDLLSYGLIGFRPREYMAALNLSDASQVNVYKQFLGTKGTKYSIDLFGNANFENVAADYVVYENWAVLKGTYGAQANRSFFDVRLNQALLTSNPSTVQVIVPFEESRANQTVTVDDLWRESYKITSPDILPTVDGQQVTDINLPSAGYVNLNDVDITEFDINNSTNIIASLDSVGVGTYIWIAKINDFDWGVYRCTHIPGFIAEVSDNLDGTSIVTFSTQHNLSVNDTIIIRFFNNDVDGVYKVVTVPGIYSITIAYEFLNQFETTIIGEGVGLILESARVAQPADIIDLPYVNQLTAGSLVWVDNDIDGRWEVLEKTEPWVFSQNVETSRLANARWGTGVAQTQNNTLALVSAPGLSTGIVYQYSVNSLGLYSEGSSLSLNATSVSGYGQSIAVGSNSFGIVGAPNSLSTVGYAAVLAYDSEIQAFVNSQVLVALDQPGPGEFGYSVAISGDERWIYVGAPAKNSVYAYGQVSVPVQVITYPTDGQTLRFSTTGIQYDNINQLDVYIEDRPQRLGVDYTATLSYIQFTALTGPNQTIYIYRRQRVQLDFEQYLAIAPNTTTGVGESATFNIDVTRGVYSATVNNAGYNYSVGEVLTIYGTQIGGATPSDDCVITVVDTTFAGSITEFTVSGSRPAMQDRFNINQYLYTAQNINSFTVTVNGTVQRPKFDYEWEESDSSLPDSTLSDYDLVFVNSPAAGAEIFVDAGTYYAYVGRLTVSGLADGDRFGHSVATNSDGSEVLVGCAYRDVNSRYRAGSAYVFDRNIQRYNVDSDMVSTPTFTPNGTVTFPPSVSVNGVYLNNTAQWGTNQTNTYTVNYVGNPYTVASVTINQPLTVGQVVEIETNQFALTATIEPQIDGENAQFGSAVAFGLFDCSAVVGAPNTQMTKPQQGIVEICVNQSKLYGTITSTLTPVTITAGYTIRINNYEIAVPNSPNNTPAGLVDAINAAGIPNIIAAVSSSGLITIDLINKAAATPFNQLSVAPGAIGVGANSAFNLLGFEPYYYIQSLTSPYPTDGSKFGTSISAQGYELIIGAPKGTPHIIDTFDEGTTTFDANSTGFYTDISMAGVAYQFDYLRSFNASITNPGAYTFGQQVYYNQVADDYDFGQSVNYVGTVLLVGSPGAIFNDTVIDNGAFAVYKNNNQAQAWAIRHREEPAVDIYSLNSVTLYDRLQSARTYFLDFFNPLQGKILGAARQNIDFIGAFDPAGYNTGPIDNQGNSWGASRVGQIWWDTRTVRFVDPGQDDITYASRRWGQIFPGSAVDIYQWTQSTVPPAEYTGPGIPYSVLSYSVGTQLTASGAFVTEYFFWVKGITTVNTAAKKTLSAEAVSRYIEAPIASGIPFMAPLTSSCFALYNSGQYFSAYDTIVHIEFDRQLNDANIHTEFQLLAQGKSTSFLTPTLYRKLQDSFCGVDPQGSAVPDTTLSPAERYGVQFRPRQSMFVNRYAALQNYITRTNTVLLQYPIAESRTLTLLNSEEPIPSAPGNYNEVVANLEELSWQNILIVPLGYNYLVLSDSNNNGRWTIYTVELNDLGLRVLVLTKVQSYDTKEYWSYVDWYDPSFNKTTTPSVEVASYAELITLTVPVGTVALVTANSQGKFEIYQLYDTGWQRVGLQDGTIQISTGIWDYAEGKLGFDGEVFDAQYFDQTPQIETRKIIQSINEELFIDELLIERNSLVTLMFNYILTEQLAPQWLTKTSLIDVEHTIRELLPYPIYRRDNQDFVLDYLNEVKPYHVQIREFNLRYNGFDDFAGDITDFDLPAYFDTTVSPSQYVSPILASTVTEPSDKLANDAIWQTSPYNQWFNNYTLYVEQIVITNGGTGYSSVPTVNIIGTAVRPATALAKIDSAGTVFAIDIIDAGEGYITTPTITITGGNGTGAKAAIYMTNGLVRSITTTIKFDRCEYNTNIVEWQPDVTFDNGQLVRFGDRIWAANSPDSTGVNTPTFDPVDWILVPINDLSGVDRTMGYYVAGVNQPGRELPLLIDGVDYPGVQVAGVPFEYDTGFDRGPFDVTPWDNIDFGPEGRPTYSDTILNAQYESSFLDIYLGTRAGDVNVDGGAFVDTFSSYAPQELVPGQEFDTMDMRVYTRPGLDWSGGGFGFPMLQLRAEFNPVIPEIFWGNVGESLGYLEIFPSAIEVSNATQGIDLILDVDYTVDWVNRTVLITGHASLSDIIVITVFQLGGGNQLLQQNFNGLDVGVDLEIDVRYNEIYQLAIFVNGQVLTVDTDYTYEVSPTNPAKTLVHFLVVLTNLDAICLTALGYQDPQNTWSLPQTQYIVVPEIMTFAAQLTYTLENYWGGSNPDNVWVEVNGRTLRPSEGIQWYSDGSSAEYLMPQRGGYSQGLIADNEVHVYVNDVPQVLGSDFVVVPWDGFSPRTIMLSYVPPVGDLVLICVNTRADYIVGYNGTDWEITFRPSSSFGLYPGDIIGVTSWNDTAQQNIVQMVWVGPIYEGGVDFETYDEYPFDFGSIPFAAGSYDYSEGITLAYNDLDIMRVNQNPTRMIVTLNGIRLFNGLDFTILQEEFTSFIQLNVTLGPLDVVVATMFTSFTVPEAMAFRIFQDMRGIQTTYRILPTTTTELAEPCYYDDDYIKVVNALACGAPDLNQNAWGVVTIGGERIMYRYRDVNTNTLSGLLRGTAGTAAADHARGDEVISMGRESILLQGYEDMLVHTDTVANGSQTTFTAPNVNITSIDSTEYAEALIVLVGGVPVPPTQYILNSPNPVSVTLFDTPRQGLIVTIGVMRSLSWYQPGPDTPSNGVPLQFQETVAGRFLRGQV